MPRSSRKLQEELDIDEEVERRAQPQKQASSKLEEEAAKRKYKQEVLREYRLPKIREERERRELREEKEAQRKRAAARRGIVAAVPTGTGSSRSGGSAPIALALGGIGAILLVSGIQGKSLADVLSGEFGSKTDPSAKPVKPQETEPIVGQTGETGVPPGFQGAPGGTVSPFPKGTKIIWGRNDQGVDGTTKPGTLLRAMRNGTVEIGHNPSGFGSSYPILHTDSGQVFYYGHAEPIVASGTRVQQGQPIGRTHIAGTWGNSTTPGGFEIGEITGGAYGSPPGSAIRKWLQSLPMI